MADDEQIEACAHLCDAMIRELETLKPTVRKGQYDRQAPRQIDYAIRAVRRLAERIRALKGLAQIGAAPVNNGDKLAKAIALAGELRPIIALGTRDSEWRRDILARLDDLIG